MIRKERKWYFHHGHEKDMKIKEKGVKPPVINLKEL
jgi:hypothetical protein